MMDLKDYLLKKKLVFNQPGEESQQANVKVLSSRNELLARARGSIREHLQQQMISALNRFNDESTSIAPEEIV